MIYLLYNRLDLFEKGQKIYSRINICLRKAYKGIDYKELILDSFADARNKRDFLWKHYAQPES